MRRNVLGLLAMVWLNMAILPCAMAFQSDEICPHCPPADEHEMASHHGHGEFQAESSSTTAQSECCDLDEASVDALGGKLQVEPASEVVFVAAPAIAELPARVVVQRHCVSDPPDTPGVSPPLHVLYCVYLK
jgi:hypothetical protein